MHPYCLDNQVWLYIYIYLVNLVLHESVYIFKKWSADVFCIDFTFIFVNTCTSSHNKSLYGTTVLAAIIVHAWNKFSHINLLNRLHAYEKGAFILGPLFKMLHIPGGRVNKIWLSCLHTVMYIIMIIIYENIPLNLN